MRRKEEGVEGGEGSQGQGCLRGSPAHLYPKRQLPLTKCLEQQRAVEGEDERRQVLQTHHRHVAVNPHHLGGKEPRQ